MKKKKSAATPNPQTASPQAKAARQDQPAKPWRGHLLRCIVLFLMVYIVYSNSFQSGFVLDNKTVIQQNPANKQATWENLKLIWTKDYWWPRSDTGGYRPITSTTYLLNWSVFGNGNHEKEADRVVGFHWFNLVVHGINAFLAYLLALKLLRRPWLAFFAAALFAVHPIAAESVTNIIGRADEFATLSFLGATWLFIRSTEAQGPKRIGWLLATMAVFEFGCFSKESTPAFMAIPFLYDAIFRWGSDSYADQRIRRIGFDCVVDGVITLPFWVLLYVRSLVFANTPAPANIVVDNPMLRYLWSDANSLSVNVHNWLLARLTACNVTTKALWKLFWPAQLSSDYSYNQIPLFNWNLSDIENIKAILSALFIVVTLAVAVWCYKRHKAVCFLILFYWVAYGPTSSFTRIAPSIFGERFLYLPSFAFCVLLMMSIDAVLRRAGTSLEFDRDSIRHPWPRLVPQAVLLLILVLCATRTYARNFDWRSDMTLAQSAIKASPNAFRGYQTLAFNYYEIDPTTSIDRIIELGEKAIAILDSLPPVENTSRAYLHMGMYYGIKGEMGAARNPDGSLVMDGSTRTWYEKSARILERGSEIDLAANEDYRARQLKRGRTVIPDVGISAIYMYLGITYSGLGKNETALEAFKYARHLDPKEPMAYFQLASVQGALGHTDAAAVALLQALLLDPSRAEVWQTLGDLYSQINKEPIPAIEQKDGRPELREDNKMVQRHLVEAYREFAQIARLAEQPDLVDEARRQAAVHHIDPKVLDATLDSNGAKASRPRPPAPLFHTFGK